MVNRHQSALFYFGLRLLGSREDANDLLQDVLMVLCRNLGQYRGDSSFKSWLFGIANYRAMDMLRRRKYSDNDDELAEMPADHPGLPEQLASDQQQKQVQQQLRSLPAEQRLVLELKFYQQFTFDEIASQLAISSNTVKSRFYAALDKLRLQLEDDHVEQSANF
nr:sigma-70 family RNA polymerase sigma factor [Rheinheimera oceanensis]